MGSMEIKNHKWIYFLIFPAQSHYSTSEVENDSGWISTHICVCVRVSVSLHVHVCVRERANYVVPEPS